MLLPILCITVVAEFALLLLESGIGPTKWNNCERSDALSAGQTMYTGKQKKLKNEKEKIAMLVIFAFAWLPLLGITVY